MRITYVVSVIAAVLLVSNNAFALKLQWVPNTETDLAGYKVHCAVGEIEDNEFTHIFDVGMAEIVGGKVTVDYPRELPDEGVTCAATAYDTGGEESGYSNVDTFNPPPAEPTGFEGVEVINVSGDLNIYNISKGN